MSVASIRAIRALASGARWLLLLFAACVARKPVALCGRRAGDAARALLSRAFGPFPGTAPIVLEQPCGFLSLLTHAADALETCDGLPLRFPPTVRALVELSTGVRYLVHA